MSRLRAWPARHDKTLIGVAVLILVATAVYLIIALSNVTGRQDRIDDARERSEATERTRTAQRNALAADVNDLRAQVLRCKDKPAETPGCTVPVAPPPGVTVRSIVGPTGTPGAVGSPGLPGATGRDGASVTTAQVAFAVARFCAFGSCSRPPSPSQVSSAVVAFCADGSCAGRAGADGAAGDQGAPGGKGADGSNGAPGAPGSDGTAGPTGAPGQPGVDGPTGAPGSAGATGAPGADGAPGSNVTPEQVAAAVADYCSTRGNCAGPTGATGADGAPGPVGPQGAPGADSTVPGPAGANGAPGAAGRGIASIACEDRRAAVFTVTYSDGSTATVTCTPPR